MISKKKLVLFLLILLAYFCIVYFEANFVSIKIMAQLKKYGSAVDVRQPDISVAHQSGVDDLSVVVTDNDFLDDSHIDDDPGSASTRFPFGSTGVVVQKQNVKRFYTKTLDLFEKVRQFNEFLKKDIVRKKL